MDANKRAEENEELTIDLYELLYLFRQKIVFIIVAALIGAVGAGLVTKLIITPTASGYTTQMVSKYRPKAGILAFTSSGEVARHLNLRWGVDPIASPHAWASPEEMTELAVAAAQKNGFAKAGDRTVITSGIKDSAGNTSAIRVYTIG